MKDLTRSALTKASEVLNGTSIKWQEVVSSCGSKFNPDPLESFLSIIK